MNRVALITFGGLLMLIAAVPGSALAAVSPWDLLAGPSNHSGIDARVLGIASVVTAAWWLARMQRQSELTEPDICPSATPEEDYAVIEVLHI